MTRTSHFVMLNFAHFYGIITAEKECLHENVFFLYQPFDDRSIMLQGVYLYQSYANTPILLLWPDWWWISPALVRNFLLHAHTNTLYIMQGARFYGNICGSQTDTQKVTAKCKRSEPLPATDSVGMNRLKMWWVNNRQLADVLVELVSSL